MLSVKRIKKGVGWVLIVYVLYAVLSVIGFTYVRINQATKEASNISPYDLASFQEQSTAKEYVGMTHLIEDALPLRLELIDKAQEQLLLAQYTISPDDAGLLVIDHLASAAKCGVKIQLIVNGLSNNTRESSSLQLLTGYDNVEIKQIGGINLLKPWEMNNVVHDKLLIVDDSYLLSSGRNISDRFMIPSETKGVTRDMDVVIQSDGDRSKEGVLFQGKTYFNELWMSQSGKVVKDYPDSSKKRKKEREYQAGIEQSRERNKVLLQHKVLDNMALFEVDKGYLVHNPTDQLVKVPVVWQQMTHLMNQSEKHVELMSPYVVMTNPMWSFVHIPKEREFTVYTNSGGTSLNIFAFGGYLTQKKTLQKMGNIWEFQSKDSIHQKAFAVDDTVFGIGSLNTDSRSAFLSHENMVIVKSKGGADQLQSIMKDYENQSLKATGLFSYAESDKVEESKVSFFKQMLLLLFSLISPVIRLFL